MAVPSHGGFYVPNAADVTNPRMAEPDRIDFATAANARWGVVEGCQVTITGIIADITAGVAVIDGLLVTVNSQSAQVGIAGTKDRFDALVIDRSGTLKVITGDYATDPVFPDVPQDNVLLATVFAPTGASSYTGNVIDKRRFVSRALLTKVVPGADLIRNVNGDGDHYLVSGNGTTVWEGDTRMYRSAPRTLRIEDFLIANGDITAINNVYAKNLIGSVSVQAPNLLQGSEFPPVASSPPGAIFQKTDGTLWVNNGTAWEALVTAKNAIPIGTVITSVEPQSAMAGWLLLDGSRISEQQHPLLFKLAGLQDRIEVVGGQNTMLLPDCRDRVLMGGTTGIRTGGNQNPGFRVLVKVNNMPRHKHNVLTKLGGGATINGQALNNGDHGHTMSEGGTHTHDVVDLGHSHFQGEYPFGSFVCLEWGGQNKIDALFNDRNHTYSVGASPRTRSEVTGITVGHLNSGHQHVIDNVGGHEHLLRLDRVPEHKHDVLEDEIGGTDPIDITPPYISFYTYIRSGS